MAKLIRTEGTTVPASPAGTPARGLPRQGLAVVAGLVVLAAVLRLFGSGAPAWVTNFLLIFSSLLVQAFPFVLLGAVASAALEVFVPGSVFARIGRLPSAVQVPAGALSGVAFPVCECGSVPVARRLARRGVAPGAAIAFMLAAPIINPIVLVATAMAYRGRGIMWLMVGGRFGIALVAAVVAGWILGTRNRGELFRPTADDAEDHPHEPRTRLRRFFIHFSDDAVYMGKYLVVGAALAGAIQTFVPQRFIGSVAGTPILDVLVLMGLAAVLSLCSESDAFVAASFVQFSAAAQLGFLLVGPMFNIKLAALYTGTFSRGFLRRVFVVVVGVTLVGALWVEALVR